MKKHILSAAFLLLAITMSGCGSDDSSTGVSSAETSEKGTAIETESMPAEDIEYTIALGDSGEALKFSISPDKWEYIESEQSTYTFNAENRSLRAYSVPTMKGLDLEKYGRDWKDECIKLNLGYENIYYEMREISGLQVMLEHYEMPSSSGATWICDTYYFDHPYAPICFCFTTREGNYSDVQEEYNAVLDTVKITAN